jgi:hypothetical protein
MLGIGPVTGEEAEGLKASRSTPQRDAGNGQTSPLADQHWETKYHVAS